MNSSLYTADRATHLKIFWVSLAAAMIVVAIGLAARPAVTVQLQTRSSIVKPSKAITWINRDPAGLL